MGFNGKHLSLEDRRIIEENICPLIKQGQEFFYGKETLLPIFYF